MPLLIMKLSPIGGAGDFKLKEHLGGYPEEFYEEIFEKIGAVSEDKISA